MLLKSTIDYKGRVTKRVFNGFLKAAYAFCGAMWHKEMLPKHFTQSGAREYGYLPRKGEPGNPHRKGFWASYTGRKLREKGHRRPLEWSGQSRRLTRIRDVRATSKGAKVMTHARGFNRRNPHSQINMHQELGRVSWADEKQIGWWFDNRLEHQIRHNEHRSTTRIR